MRTRQKSRRADVKMITVMEQPVLRTIALFLIYLTISLAFIVSDTAAQAANQTGTIPLDVALPAATNRNTIDVQGTTAPSIIVMLFVNANNLDPASATLTTQSSSQGDFLFFGIRLQQGTNTIAVKVTDTSGNENSKIMTIASDTEKPVVTISPIPKILNDTQFALKGTTNKPVKATFSVSGKDSVGQDFNASQSVDLPAGDFVLDPKVIPDAINAFKVVFADTFGNTVEFTQDIVVDVSPPQFLKTNIDLLSPTYTQRVVLKGKVSKPGIKVVAFVNGEAKLKRDENNITSAALTGGSRPTQSFSTGLLDSLRQLGSIALGNDDYSATADKDGMFSIPVYLSQVINTQTQQQNPDQTLPQTQVGITTGSTTPLQTPTGYPNGPDREFDNKIILVAIDNAGHVATTQGTIKFSKCGTGGDWNIDIGQINPASVTPELLRLGIAQVAFPVKLTYQGTFTSEPPLITRAPFIRTYELNQEIRQKSFMDPLKAVRRVDARWDDSYKNAFVILELNSFNYTQKEIKDMFHNRTMRIPLQIEIPYQAKFFDAPQQLVQRQCWDVSLFMDIEVPLNAIPSALLEHSVAALNATIKVIDTILKPLKTITVFAFVTCLGSWAVLFWARAQERFACFPNKSPKTDEKCRDAEQGRLSKEHYFKLICDRVYCPSVKSITYFMRTHKAAECHSFSAASYADADFDNLRKEANDYFKDKEFDDFLPVTEGGKGTYEAGESINGQSGKSWQDLCIYDYVSQYDTSCLLMNEVKQSVNVEVPKTDTNKPGQPHSTFGAMCNWANKQEQRPNTEAVCTAGVGGASVCYAKDDKGNWYLADELRRTQTQGDIQIGPSQTQYHKISGEVDVHDPDLKLRGGPYAYEGLPYVGGNVNVSKITARLGTEVSVGLQKAKLWKDAGSSIPGDTSPDAAVAISDSGQVFIKTTPGPADSTARWISGSLQDPTLWKYWHPNNYLGQNGNKIPYGQQGKALKPPTEVARNYDAAKNIIINPASGIIRALQCVCLPAITGYLALIRNVLYQVKLCFETILLTGQGKSGLCRAVLTMYVCDLVVDAIKCFFNKYGEGSIGIRNKDERNGIRGFLGAMRGAGADISKKIRDRYGDKNLYQAMFNERKLIHQACLFAFTGDFDLDVEGLLTAGSGIPLKSTGFLYPHNRRFIAYDPKTGQSMHIYHTGVGLVAGTNLFYELDFVCSNDISCNPTEGFENGKCDCYGKQERIRPIRNYQSLDKTETLTNRLSAGQVLGGSSGDIYLPLQDDVRYDKVRLRWWWYEGVQPGTGGVLPATSTIVQSPGSPQPVGALPSGSLQQTAGPGVVHQEQIEKQITQIGTLPPAECTFEITSGFLCKTVLGSKGSIRFTEIPKAASTFYHLGDEVKLTFALKKESPGYDPNNPQSSYSQVPKLLCYKTYYNDPKLKYAQIMVPSALDSTYGKPNDCLPIITDGEYTEESADFTRRVTSFRITQDLFTQRLGAGLPIHSAGIATGDLPDNRLECMKAPQATDNKAPVFTVPQIDRDNIVVDPGAPDTTVPLAVVIMGVDTDGKTVHYKVFKTTSDKMQAPCIPKDGAADIPNGVMTDNRIIVQGITIPFKAVPKAGDAIVVSYKSTGPQYTGQGTLQCDDFNNEAKAANLKVVVELREPRRLDPTRALDLDNYDPNPENNEGVIVSYGKQMSYEVLIKAICTPGTGAQAAAPTPTTTAPVTPIVPTTTVTTVTPQPPPVTPVTPSTAPVLVVPPGHQVDKGDMIGLYEITSPYGERRDPFDRTVVENHKGVDIAPTTSGSTSVRMPYDGSVNIHTTDLHSECGYGAKLDLDAAPDYAVILCHLAALPTQQRATAGQNIATMGDTGDATGVHLHVAVLQSGNNVEPSRELLEKLVGVS